MNEKTKTYVQFIKENHRDFGGKITGAMVAKELGISQGRVSQLLKEIREENAMAADIKAFKDETAPLASTAEA